MNTISDLTNRINQSRLQQRLAGSAQINNRQVLTGVSVRQRVAYTGVIGVSGTLGTRNPSTGQSEVLTGDGSIRQAQSLGFGGFPQGQPIPSVVIDAGGGWIDY